MAVFAPTATNMYVKQRIPTFYDRDDDDKEVTAIDAKEYDELAEEEEEEGGDMASRIRRRMRRAEGAEVEKHFPKGVLLDAEMDVRVVRVHDEYSLVRPVDYPRLKGKLNNVEMSELADENRATGLVALNDVYRASVLHLKPPDKVIFSLRRVRRVLRDDFQPYTIVLFNVPAEMNDSDVRRLMEDHGKILDITMSPFHEEEPDIPVRVTFLHQDDGMAAIKKWNKAAMPVVVEDDDGKERTIYRRVRCKKSHKQKYREQIQNFLDYRLQQNIIEWDKTPGERRYEERLALEMQEIIPWYYIDRETQRQTDWMFKGYDAFPEYTVKNNARKAIPVDGPPPNII
jgi:hypothetical protein